jgi:hypothetical protein
MSDRRRQARLWIGIASIPVVLLALALVGKWLSMYVFAQGAIAAHIQEDGPAGISRTEKLEPFNWFEEWKAPYDKGVALADADRLTDSRTSFEQALDLATGLDVCPVRTNLGIVIERMGDQARAANPDWAAQLYAEALTLTLETPQECRSDEAREQSPDPSRDPDQELDDTEQRLREKMQDQPQEPQEQEPEEQEPQEDDSLGDIEERLQDGQRQREEQQRQGEENGGSGSGVEKPW